MYAHVHKVVVTTHVYTYMYIAYSVKCLGGDVSPLTEQWVHLVATVAEFGFKVIHLAGQPIQLWQRTGWGCVDLKEVHVRTCTCTVYIHYLFLSFFLFFVSLESLDIHVHVYSYMYDCCVIIIIQNCLWRIFKRTTVGNLWLELQPPNQYQ